MIVVFLSVLLAFVSLLLIGIVLMQDSKGGGLAGAFGGSGGTELLGTSGQKQIAKVTTVISGVFVVLCIAIGLLKGLDERSSAVAADDPVPATTIGPVDGDPDGASNPLGGLEVKTSPAPGGGVTISPQTGPAPNAGQQPSAGENRPVPGPPEEVPPAGTNPPDGTPPGEATPESTPPEGAGGTTGG